MTIGTGYGAQVSYGTQGSQTQLGSIIRILPHTDQVRIARLDGMRSGPDERFNRSTLGNVKRGNRGPGDLRRRSTWTVVSIFDTEIAYPIVNTEYPIVRIDWPLRSGEATQAYLTGLGVCVAFRWPLFEKGILQTVTVTWRWLNPPTYVLAT